MKLLGVQKFDASKLFLQLGFTKHYFLFLKYKQQFLCNWSKENLMPPIGVRAPFIPANKQAGYFLGEIPLQEWVSLSFFFSCCFFFFFIFISLSCMFHA